MAQNPFKEKAIQYAEKYGIVDYTLKENIMTYTELFPLENCRYIVHVDVNTQKEKNRVCVLMTKKEHQ